MQGLWIVIAFLVGGAITYFLISPRITRAQSEADAERKRATDLDGSRQKLEGEISVLRQVAPRIDQLTAGGEEDRTSILDLTQKHSAATTSIEERDKLILELRGQITLLSEEATPVGAQLTQLAIDRAALREREAALRDEREQLAEARATFRT